MDNPKFKPKWNPFKFKKLRLYGAKGPSGKSPTITMDVWENNPRFKLYLNNGSFDKPITMATDPFINQTILLLIEDVAKDDTPQRFSVDIKGFRDHRGNRYDKATPIARIHIGRGDDGVVFIAFQPKGEEPAKFVFGQQWYAPIMDSSGEEMAPQKMSSLHARAWAGLYRAMFENNIITNSVEPKPKDGQGGGGNNSYSSGGGGSADFDDDITF